MSVRFSRSLRGAIVLLCLFAGGGAAALSQNALDSLGIAVRGSSREFAYTNKESAYLYGETSRPNRNSWQGFNVFGHRFIEDYDLVVEGRVLDRSTAVVTVYPDHLRRVYPGGITEELLPLDSVAAFAVRVSSPARPAAVDFVPWLSDGRDSSAFVTVTAGGKLAAAARRHQARTPADNYPVWIAVQSRGGSPVRGELRQGTRFAPASVRDPALPEHLFVAAVADSASEAGAIAGQCIRGITRLTRQRRDRMERLLASTAVTTDDARLNRALAWAKLSLDALIMDQVGKGIFAGLPWFNNYWGRDTFIALPGAALVTGRFAEARQILLSVAAFQNSDSSSTDWGRIPNIVTTTEKAYNTADGTPRFVIMAREYVERSGDTAFIRTVYPVVRRAADGTIRHHSDSLGFLVHGDAETWMDAVGPNGPWSPRGNRGNDIQALWVEELDASLWFARACGDDSRTALWKGVRDRCAANFLRYFVKKGDDAVADHLRPDGTADLRLRPNQIFTGPLLDDRTRAAMVHTVASKLTYDYGVASLSQDDPDFHPYHQYEPLYPKDAAYHNGTVWTWMQGPLISELCRLGHARLAYRITRNSIHQILDRGAVGTQSELLDAIARPGEGEPRLSGTFSQAWNLGEFVRNFYDDYLGVRVDRLRRTLLLHPHLPLPVAQVRARVNLEGEGASIALDFRPGIKSIVLSSQEMHDSLSAVIELPLGGGRMLRALCSLPPHQTITLALRGEVMTGSRSGAALPVSSWIVPAPPDDSLLDPPTLATPVLHRGLKALRGPSYPLLPVKAIKADNPRAGLFVDAADPAGDDTGAGGYTYPRNPVFAPGSFDITHFTVRTDSTAAYFRIAFRALSDPGWHPEYGFQLTYLAIAIDQDGLPGSGTREVPANSSFMLPPGRGYERLILVGGGVQVEDAWRTVLAAYIPVSGDEAKPLGDARSGTISFAVPLACLGTPSGHWTFTVLAGAQDDHGGAGLGEFRSVNAERGEWTGGGKKHPGDPNVYDVLVAQPEAGNGHE